MKNLITITAILFGTITFAQTNRIAHYSHSGSKSTLNVFAANDNMGLGWEQDEYFKRQDSLNRIKDPLRIDSLKIDSLKTIPQKVCTPKAENRKGLSFERKYDVESVLRRSFSRKD